jgi:hypothetical protein
MTKQEFLEELKQALSGEVTPEAMMDSYRYYDSYIDECIRKGQSEQEVTEALGRPYLIARSIIAAQTGERVADEEYTEDGRTRRVRHKEKIFSDTTYTEPREKKEFTFDPGAWYAKILYALILVLLVLIVFCVLKGLVWVFVTFGIPVLIVLGIIYLIMYFVGQ